MSGRVDGKTVIVSGAARGQGASHARLLAREGARVVVADILEGEGEETAQQIARQEGRATFQHLDVTDADEWEAVVDETVRAHGKLDALVNNAGITAYEGAATCATDEWQRVIAVNQSGVFFGMRAAIAAMQRSGGGVIVNTSSIFGLYGAEGYFAYVASKAAVIGMTKSAALTYGRDNIRVNAVAPGVVDTAMLRQEMSDLGPEGIEALLADQPISRPGRPEDIAYAVLYFVSDESSFVTGEILTVDGGYSAK